MPSYDYHNLGGISTISDGPQVPYSKRGHDQDRFQNFVFECDSASPFTGVVHLQISQNEPPLSGTGADLTWCDIARLEFANEGGTIFLQVEIEAAQIRAVAKSAAEEPINAGLAGAIKTITTMR